MSYCLDSDRHDGKFLGEEGKDDFSDDGRRPELVGFKGTLGSFLNRAGGRNSSPLQLQFLSESHEKEDSKWESISSHPPHAIHMLAFLFF